MRDAIFSAMHVLNEIPAVVAESRTLPATAGFHSGTTFQNPLLVLENNEVSYSSHM